MIVEFARTHSNSEDLLKFLEQSTDGLEDAEKAKMFGAFGYVLHKYGFVDSALRTEEYARDLYVKLQDKRGEAIREQAIGNLLVDKGSIRLALAHYRECLRLAKETGETWLIVDGLESVGLANVHLSHTREAIKYLEKALKLSEKIEDNNLRKSREAICRSNMGDAFKSLGDLEKSVENYKEATSCSLEIGWKRGACAGYTNLGVVYSSLGYSKEAQKCFTSAMNYATQYNERVNILESASVDLIIRGKEDEAEEHLFDLINEAEKVDDEVTAARAFNERGIVCEHRAREGENVALNLKLAREFYETALEAAKRHDMKELEIGCYGNLGNLAQLSGDIETSAVWFEDALKASKVTENRDYERIANHDLAFLYLEQDPNLAYDYCRRAVELSETMGLSIVQDKLRIGFGNSISETFKLAVRVCLILNKYEQAFEYVEHSKSRALLELLATSPINPTVAVTDDLKQLVAKEEECLVKLRQLQREYRADSRGNDPTVTTKGVDVIKEELNTIYKKIQPIDPEYASLRSGRILSFSDLKDFLSSQQRDMLIVEYFVMEDEVAIFLVSTRDSKLHVERVPLPATKRRSYLQMYTTEVLHYLSSDSHGHEWQSISDYLIKPISHLMARKDLIYFVPHGVLNYLPLHALVLDNEPIICNHPVAYSHSASLLPFYDKKGTGRLESCAAFGMVFEDEADKVAKIFQSKPYLNYQVKHEVVRTCSDKDIIHLSCHGEFDLSDALNSRIILSDGPLTAREIFNLRLNTELVTLSACQSGINETTQGDELIGLVRSFLYAGASSVIASFWSVEPEATEELLVNFYNRLREKEDKATALQEAQKSLMQKKEYADEYFWAPFSLFGKWK